ncbi:HypC/HybG/HupF family hydrogenase formation chaperone [Candidatus Aerophobetes bacterium]|uniref:HypC/HybG/HupF family hydrogenase formation chaperone n=1 Tax=Aerophobetes bacterium TaxID=2030807 RepID=A0A497E3C3_UNCAE|nr:HypC/HybG/HupF family hydrogenase formation chaperone [Candidatus Aerophobetes bacterium]RLE08005.1 MAG: HypC/HybG/HupF family hydrogenase formation chaperone [Candidatus Aerophobetes bacterium]
MCLAIPLKLISKEGTKGWVEVGGAKREISLIILPEAKVGDYVLVHAGFAISKVEEKEAQELLELLSTIK